MKKILLISLGLALAPSAFADNHSLNTVEQKASYTLGADIAKNFRSQGLEIDIKAFSLGLEDALKERDLKLSEEEMMSAINTVKDRMQKQQLEKQKSAARKNLDEGKAFLAENAKKEGVVTLDSGVQYKVLTKGKGESPTAEDTISAHYRGTLLDSSEFDSSYQRGTPLTLQMGSVIKGWGEVLKIMNPGSKWEVYIPSDMAYGEKGAGDAIGPNQALVFTIELISFEPAKK
ncbi:FKBP-type peptidyl-prolyl cis-trans isomerase FklB [hydrothermal vent metagenome]|uniref:peptidylprolyl isomerase n=1 Tax=hydrothermal vent metagenome TaxID=652676 RepID=A0A3B0WBX0_9ZZZZ